MSLVYYLNVNIGTEKSKSVDYARLSDRYMGLRNSDKIIKHSYK